MFSVKPILLAILFLSTALSVFAQDEPRATAAWQVKSYDITAALPQNLTDRAMPIKANMTLQNVGTAPGTRLTLRVNSLAQVSGVKVNDADATVTKGEEKIGTSQRTVQRIIVSVPNVQPKGSLNITVDYTLKVDENSGLNALAPMNSQFLPLSFWYPTPNSHYSPKGPDFAPFKLTVTPAPGETIIASGVQSGNTFEQKLNGQPFFTSGSWDTVESKGVTVYLPKGASDQEKQRGIELANLALEAKTYTASLLGAATEVPMRIVAVRQGAGFADAGTIFLEYAAFRRQKIDAGTVMTIGESVAKIWLGNAKLVRGDGYGVIREGLSLFVATQFLEKQYGQETADIERLRQRTAYAAVAKLDSPLFQTSPLDGSYFSSMANKGAMVWRVLAKQIGRDQFFSYLKGQDVYSVLNLRTAFSNTYPIIDYWQQNATDTNLMAGLPQISGGETRVALRNTGGITVNVNVAAITDKGERLVSATSIPEKGFGEAVFKTTAKIIRTEVDPEKMYPQLDYSDDVAPREFTESDLIAAIKRSVDKQEFANAEKSARTVLQTYPHFDDARTWLGRVLLAQNKNGEAEREFKAALDEKLPTALTMAWANLGLGEISAKAGQNSQALAYYDLAIKADAEYGANLAARRARMKLETSPAVDESIKAFFGSFDKAVLSARKAEVEALIVPGDVAKFAVGAVSSQPSIWQTKVLRTEKVDANRMLAETEMSVKRIGSDLNETGTATFVLVRIGGSWKLAGVEVFEVR
jgi:tetratricopeptide (TPR) repeat protein